VANQGGGVFADENTTVTVTACAFERNRVELSNSPDNPDGLGGAIYLVRHPCP
jgi:hypothetical protein